MNIKTYLTEDGSSSIYNETLGEGYHSRHGAVQESRHVFMLTGLQFLLQQNQSAISILEIGFGTGLNALLTALENNLCKYRLYGIRIISIIGRNFTGFELCDVLGNEGAKAIFQQIHAIEWNKKCDISPHFSLEKKHISLLDFQAEKPFDLVYFDAFAPEIQPELWTEKVFLQLFDCMKAGGILVTYCAKGSVRRAMKSAGFQVERLPGPPPKREMLRACKK